MRSLGLAVAVLLAIPAAAAADETLRGDPLSVTVRTDPWRIEIADGRGVLLSEHSDARLGIRTAAGWDPVLRAVELRAADGGIVAVAQTSAGATLDVRIGHRGDGIVRMEASVRPPARPHAFRIGFATPEDERFFGFGSRSDRVDHRGREVENYVADGPNRPEDRNYPRAVVPPWSHGDRDDSTYYPVPWLLSSRGYGALIARDETSRFELARDPADAWVAEVDAPALALEIYAGPTPAQALGRFTLATGPQPPPPAPWSFGPWFQTGQPNRVELDDEAAMIKVQRDAGVPVSAAETQMHFLPCGAHREDPAYNAARTKQFHDAGLMHLVYFNPSLCVSYDPVWRDAAAAGVLLRERTGEPHVYPAFVGGSGPAGFTSEPLSQFDFTAPGTADFYGRLLEDAVKGHHDGWMEDFGEGAPPTAVAADGTSGSALHNRYPVDYHCAVERIVKRFPVVLNRHIRSGWTGSARCSPTVWGGDPTTVWDYDGLQSALRQALGIGMSGVSRFGTDIGGYNTYGPQQNLTPELLARWIQFGAVSGVMRTKYSGLAFPSYDRPQVFDPELLPIWKRYTRLHTDLYPYILAADTRYRATGMPLMAHMALHHPRDPRALAADDQMMFGRDLLAAPVLTQGATTRKLYLPRGVWIDWWTGARHRGGAEIETAAALDTLPLFVRAGSVIPLLPGDVDTLAPYGGRGIVRLEDRADRLRLRAHPGPTWAGSMYVRERLSSRLLRRRRGWVLGVRGRRMRTYTVEAHLPFRACRASARPSYRSGASGRKRLRVGRGAGGVTRVRARLRSGRVVVRPCPRPRRPRAGSSAGA